MKDNTQNYFLIAAIFAVAVLTFFIFKPFLYVLALAAVFAVLFEPVHKRILKKTGDREIIAALLTTLSVLALIFIPLLLVGVQIFTEAVKLYTNIANSGKEGMLGLIGKGLENLPFLNIDISNLDKYIEPLLGSMVNNVGSIFSNFAKLFANTFIFLIALYYLLKDGDKLSRSVAAISPLSDEYDAAILKKLGNAIVSVVRGNLIIALIQGTITGIGLAIFGVPNPVLWGTVASVAALIPALGTSLVIVPSAIYLFFASNIYMAIGLGLWGMLAVGLIDNYLGPIIVGKRANLHPMLVLLSVLGGLLFYGPIGFILGPLTVSLLFALSEIYVEFIKSRKNNV